LSRVIHVVLFCCILMTIRCGIYSFSGSTLPSYLKTVGVPVFENRTAEFGIDEDITGIIIDAIRRDNTLKISDPGNADALLNGVVTLFAAAAYAELGSAFIC